MYNPFKKWYFGAFVCSKFSMIPLFGKKLSVFFFIFIILNKVVGKSSNLNLSRYSCMVQTLVCQFNTSHIGWENVKISSITEFEGCSLS